MNRIASTIALLVLILAGLAARAEAGFDTLNFIGGNLLGRPTDNSVTINVVPRAALECYFEYGTTPGSYSFQSALDTTAADSLHPHEVVLTGLSAGTRYYYRIRYRRLGTGSYLAGSEGTFRTRIARGQPFTFQVEGDPHMLPGEQATEEILDVTLQNMAVDSADFMVDMGDNFMLDKWRIVTGDTVIKRMLQYRRWWNQICHSIPLYLVLGNHEGEQGWDINGTDTCLPVKFTKARKNYYPNPYPDAFYTGDTIPQPFVDLREDYYAWEWGNALFVALDPYWYTTTKPQNLESNWDWTLGRQQYDWLKRTLEQSSAKFKFVFIHHLVGGKIDATARGGSEYSHFYEWGGLRSDSTWGFDAMRPGWGVPIHQLLIDNDVDIMFHGHDHFYAKQDTDGVIYQMAPQPAQNRWDSIPGQATNYGYRSGVLLGPRGYLRVNLDDTSATVAYVRTYLPAEETTGVRQNRDISDSYTILKGRKDVGVTRIIAPAGTFDSGTVVTPACSVYNYGTITAGYRVQLRLGPTYDCTVSVTGHARGTAVWVTFPTWTAGPVGALAVRCSTLLAGDESAANDAQTGTVRVNSLMPSGWVRLADLPAGPKERAIRDGGSLTVFDPARIYAFKGNGRCEFYVYGIGDNTWATRESIPALGRSGRNKSVKKGAVLVAAAGQVYAAKGNNSLEWWQYNPATGAWAQQADVPNGVKNVREGAAAVPVQIGDTTWLFFLRGSGTTDFYRFNPLNNNWYTDDGDQDPPLGISGKTYKNGSALTTDGVSIWAVKGSYNEFYRYEVATRVWTTLTPLPLIGSSGRKKKVKDGAGLAYHGGCVYALKGGSTNEAWRYEGDSNRWTQITDVPFGSGRNVRGGGALVAADNALYAFKGNNTFDFFRYGFSADLAQASGPKPQAQSGPSYPAPQFALRIAPNPFSTASAVFYSLPAAGNISLKLYDITGKLVMTLAQGYRASGAYSISVHQRASAADLASGIYLLKLKTETATLIRKLIVE